MKGIEDMLKIFGALAFGAALSTPAIEASVLGSPIGIVPGVHRHDTEIHVLGDFDNDGSVDDWALIDRATGLTTIVRGSFQTFPFTAEGAATMTTVSATDSYRIFAGVESIDDAVALGVDATVAHGGASFDIESALAVTSSVHNRVVVTFEPGTLGRNPAAAAVGRVVEGVGPSHLVPQGVADLGLATGNDSLYVVSSHFATGAAGPLFECLEEAVISPATTEATFDPVGMSYYDFHTIFDANHFIALRDEGASASRVVLFETGPAPKEVFIDALGPLLPEGASVSFGAFSGAVNTLECILWSPKKKDLHFLPVQSGAFGALTSLDFGKVPTFVHVVPNQQLFVVIFEDNTAEIHAWDGVNPPTLFEDLGAANEGTLLGALSYPDGTVALLEGSDDVSTSLRPFARLDDGSGYVEQATVALPTSVPEGARGNAITAIAYTGTPIVDADASPVEAFRFGDWGDGWFNSGANIGIRFLSFVEGSGLNYLAATTTSVGAPFDDVLVNQFETEVSAYLGSGPVGPVGPSVTISPSDVISFTRPFTPQVTVSVPGSTVYYRLNNGADWSAASGGALPQLTNSSTLDVFAVSPSGISGSVTSSTFNFVTVASDRDSDGDGVPDAIEIEYGLDPTSGPDADGDGVTDLVEILYELDQIASGSPPASSPVSDAAVQPPTGNYPASGYPVALDTGGTMDLSVSVELEIAGTSQIRTDFMPGPSSFDFSATGVPSAGTVFLQDASNTVRGSAPLRAASVDFSAVAVGSGQYHFLLATERSTGVRPVNRRNGANFNKDDGSWLQPGGANFSRIEYVDSNGDYYLEIRDALGVKEVQNESPAWTGDLAADGVDGIRLRARNLDAANPVYLRVVICDDASLIDQTVWVSRDAELLEAARVDPVSGVKVAPFRDVYFSMRPDESFTDGNGNDAWDEGESYTDTNGDSEWTQGSFIRMEGDATFDAVLANVKSIKLIHSQGPGTTTSGSIAGFGIDDVRLENSSLPASRLLAAVGLPDFSRPLIPFEPLAHLTFEENLSAWNAARESAWAAHASESVKINVDSTLGFLLYEYALEQSLNQLKGASTVRRLGSLRDGDEMAPLTGSGYTNEDKVDQNGVLLTTNYAAAPEARIPAIDFPQVILEGTSSQMNLSFPRSDGASATVSYDTALEGEYFVVRLHDDRAYRGQFAAGAVLAVEIDSPEKMGHPDLDFLYFPSPDSGYAPSTNNLFNAEDPREILEAIQAGVAANRSGGQALTLLADALYQLNSAFSQSSPETFDDPVRALRSFIREGREGLGGPDADGTPSWRAGFLALGFKEGDLDAAFAETAAILFAAQTGRTVVLDYSITVVGQDALQDGVGNVVELVDSSGNQFPLPSQFPIEPGAEFQVTGYLLDDGAAGQRIIEVASLDLVSLPRVAIRDSDNDLLDDGWEIAFHGSLAAEGFDDTDGDGFLDIEEFIQGTDPVSSADSPGGSGAQIEIQLRIELNSVGNVILSLPMDSAYIDEFAYEVSQSEDLSVWEVEEPVFATNQAGERLFVMPKETFSKLFYRIALRLR